MRNPVVRVISVFLPVLFSCSSLLSASQWSSFTNTNVVRSFTYDEARGVMVIASWGGVLTFHPDTEEIAVRGRVEGFSSADFTAVSMTSDGSILLGTADRGLDIEFGNGVIRNYTNLDGLPSNDVISVIVNGDDIWVGTTKGAAQLGLEGEILEPRNLFFAEPRDLEVRDVAFHGDTTAFATNDGLWLSYSESIFPQFTTDDGLLDNSVLSLFYDQNGDLYVGTESGVQILKTGDTLVDLIGGLSGDALIANDILSLNGVIWLATNGGVYTLDDDTWVERTSNLGTDNVISLFVTPDKSLYAGSRLAGFARWEESGWKVWELPGPSTNFLTNIVVDPGGVVWVSTWQVGTSESSLGRYDGTTWSRMTSSNSDLQYNRISALSVAPDSTVWGGTPWFSNPSGASGLSILDDSGTSDLADDKWWLFSSATSGLDGDAIRTEVVFKGKDDAWVGSWEQNEFGMRGGLDLLHDYRGEAEFRSFVDFLRDDKVSALALDHQGNLWIGYVEAGIDIFVLEPENGSDSLLLQVDPDNRDLLSESINDIKVGPLNHLWIATAAGVNEIDFFSDAANRSAYSWHSFTRENTDGGLPDLFVRDMEFQGERYVWLATPSGVSRYDRIDGRWKIFDEGNSGLIDNRVWDIYVDNVRNQVWFVTEKGISRYDPLGDLASVDVTKKITIYPNPFMPGQGEGIARMGPFSSTAALSIYSLAGKEVRKIRKETTGEDKWICWDGEDASGRPVPSGVYLVVSRSSGVVARGKIAIIR